ncbi:MAG TPA: 3-deoxy-D-manno-octulosonic acid kinase [Gammaproteobacteria bacterium]|nr:3-deoxy-D-manno-octulosonic acid kinase [Gammaproteobacteria bacterium]
MSELVVIPLDRSYAVTSAQRRAAFAASWFDRPFLEARGARRHTSTGRAPVLICETETETWVLRHYSRGGLVARFIEDHYLWRGLKRTRAFRELEILTRMRAWQLPAPEPVAAWVARSGLVYQADIITVYIPHTRALSALLRGESVPESLWRRIGKMLGEFHCFGVDHPDITAHNILVDAQMRTFLVDFDNAVIRPRGRWQRRGIARFERSLRKVAMETGTEFSPMQWRSVVAAYESVVSR